MKNTIYDITQSFEENATYGPFWNSQFPKIKHPNTKSVLFGLTLNSKFGVAACPLTMNSRYIRILSRLGFDIITYKSVRSVEWRGNKFPHWTYTNSPKSFLVPQSGDVTTSENPIVGQDVSMANSFGIHSVRPDLWQPDVEETLRVLQKGQLLILSLMCTPIEGQQLTDDAKKLAELASETSAEVFELNLACPNTDKGLGLIYEDVELSIQMSISAKHALGNRKLLIKVGYYKNQEDLKRFLKETRGVIDGISSTNTYSAKIVNEASQEFFPGRPMAGISGATVRDLSKEQAKYILQLRNILNLENFVVIGIGGVTKASHIDQYLELGCDATQTAVGAFADPYLAEKYKNSKRKLI